MSFRLLRRPLAWLIERHPRLYLRLKRMQGLRLGEQTGFLALHAELVRTGDCLMTLPERYNLWTLAHRSRSRPGALAEVGVYRGGSARILAAAKGDAALHLFDTFDGMPATEPAHDGRFIPGQLGDTSLAAVREKLRPWPDVHFHPGFFPDTAAVLPADLRFKLVHLDVDIRRSNLAALEFFYPRLLPGGCLVVHDYNATSVPGTKLAVDDFMRDKPEIVVELWHTQALIVKL